MNLKELVEKSKEMLANFVNTIGLDGDFYVSNSNFPIIWGEPLFDNLGEFAAQGSPRLEEILQELNYDEKIKKKIRERGLIVIDKNYRQNEINPDLYDTIIHEMIHANRNLLLYDAARIPEEKEDTFSNYKQTIDAKQMKNEHAYTYNNGRFEQNTDKFVETFADASQDILHGSIDTSKETIKNYENTSYEELDNLDFIEGKKDSKMELQHCVDEALVELMSLLACGIEEEKKQGQAVDIWKLIEQAEKNCKDENEDIGIICRIILKHHDFELFNWMLDPITYSQGDIHYDFFSEYTQDDKELLEELYEFNGIDLEDLIEGYEINEDDIRKIANSPEAMEELSKIPGDLTKIQDENERN